MTKDAVKNLTHEQETDAVTSGNRDLLVTSNLRYARYVAFKYSRGNASIHDDYVQQARLGLMHAAETYDPARGRFLAFASPCVHRSVSKYVTASSKAVALSKHNRVIRARSLYRRGLVADIDDMAAQTGLQPDVARLVWISLATTDARADDSVTGEEWLLGDDPGPEALTTEAQDAMVRRGAIEAALGLLPAKWADVIRLRYLGDEPATKADVGRQLGCSRQSIEQIEASAMRRLRASLAGLEAVS